MSAATGGGGAADCADVILRLFEYVDNESGPVDRERIHAHLEECGRCLAEYERDLLIKALVRRACAGQRAPEALRAQILTRITTRVTLVERGPEPS